MIVKNEAAVLARCLDCVKDIVDEIIIVDTGSSDTTTSIARTYTNKVFNFAWINDFSAARNFSFQQATKDYILWLDADDVITPKNQRRLNALKAELDSKTDFVMMKYHTAFDENGNVSLSFYRERLIKNNRKFLWQDPVHEVITPKGKIVYSDIAVEHHKICGSENPKRNLNIYRGMINDKKEFSPRQWFYYARELMYNGYLQESVDAFLKFLDARAGWKENHIEACKNLSEIFRRQNQFDKSYAALFRSFQYDLPRAEICCDIGLNFLDEGKYYEAAFWYKLALTIKPNAENGAFCLPDCYNYIPNIQLCFIYDKLNDKKSAKTYNESAAAFKPKSQSVLYNRRYFEHNGI